jgi:lysophospholipase L1-like esterase
MKHTFAPPSRLGKIRGNISFMSPMRILPAVLFLLVPLTAGAQNTTTAPASPGATDTAIIYPTNPATIQTAKAGILGLRAGDIPRYTQTGPIPNPAPARLGVLPPFPHDPNLPTIWTIGDSTVRTGVNGTGDDKVGQWGWGAPFVGYFDPTKVNVVNRAVGGTTSGSFYFGQWKAMVNLLKKGDVVIMQFGTNSGGVELRGIGDETRAATGRNGQATTYHTFGWYLRQFIAETRAKGATPVVCSLIPRNARGPDGKITRSANSQAGWARDVAAAEKADFIDLNELVARKYDAMDKTAVDALFSGSPHTSWAGAVLNAETVISGLKALNPDPVAEYYVPDVNKIPAAPQLGESAPVPPPATPTAPAN